MAESRIPPHQPGQKTQQSSISPSKNPSNATVTTAHEVYHCALEVLQHPQTTSKQTPQSLKGRAQLSSQG